MDPLATFAALTVLALLAGAGAKALHHHVRVLRSRGRARRRGGFVL